MVAALSTLPEARARRSPMRLSLLPEDRARLEALMRRGRSSARVFKRVRILQLLDQGQPPAFIREALGASFQVIQRVGQRYGARGLEAALGERPRPGAARRLSAAQEAQVLALLAGPPPEGRRRWSVRLLTREALRLGLAARLGRETVRMLLAKQA
jgi:hypothetical protein